MSGTTKIKRGASPVRRPRPQVKKRKASPKKGPTWLAKMLVALGITPAILHRTAMILTLSGAFAFVVALAQYAGVPKQIGRMSVDAVARGGFVVKNIEIDGLEHMNRDTVYSIVTDASSMSMASVDLGGIRQKLLNYGWIADAQVSRRLPDTLVVTINERQPAAVWQHNQQLSLVDATGIILEPVTAQNMRTDVPLIIGPDANKQVSAMSALLSAAPRLKSMVASATWIGNRRWDVRFHTGETLSLPEGVGAVRAFSVFADTDAAHPLLGKGYARFDARDGAHLLIKLAPKAASKIDANSAKAADDSTRHSAPDRPSATG